MTDQGNMQPQALSGKRVAHDGARWSTARPPQQSRAPSRWLWLALATLTFAMVGCAVPARAPIAPAAPPDLVFDIPPGTFDAELRGDADAYIIPSELHVQPGQAIVVRNDDHAMHYFFDIPIAPGQTVTKSFSRPGTFGYGGGLSCSVSKTGSVTVVVEAAKS